MKRNKSPSICVSDSNCNTSSDQAVAAAAAALCPAGSKLKQQQQQLLPNISSFLYFPPPAATAAVRREGGGQETRPFSRRHACTCVREAASPSLRPPLPPPPYLPADSAGLGELHPDGRTDGAREAAQAATRIDNASIGGNNLSPHSDVTRLSGGWREREQTLCARRAVPSRAESDSAKLPPFCLRRRCVWCVRTGVRDVCGWAAVVTDAGRRDG